MGTYCAAHLAAKIRDCAPNAQNGAVTVRIVENPAKFIPEVYEGLTCDYCNAPGEFLVTYF